MRTEVKGTGFLQPVIKLKSVVSTLNKFTEYKNKLEIESELDLLSQQIGNSALIDL